MKFPYNFGTIFDAKQSAVALQANFNKAASEVDRLDAAIAAAVGGSLPTGPAGGVLTGTYPNPGLGASTVGTTQIADGSIQTTDLAFSSLPPSGAAGGDLTGSYPNPTIGVGKVTSSNILDGTIANVDIAVGAAIALSKLAVDPLARANHTGTQLASTISDFSTTVQASSVGGDLSGTISNAQIIANAVGNAEIASNAIQLNNINGTLRPSIAAATTDESLRALGTTAGTAAAGNDTRLSNARTPTAHATTHAAAGSDPLTLTAAQISNFNSTVTGTTVGGDLTGTVGNAQIAAGAVTNADVNAAAAIAYSKLNLTGSIVNADVASGAAIALSKLAVDPLARANHTGTQTAATISDFTSATQAVAVGGVIGGTVGAATLGTGVVTSANILDGTILNEDINTGAQIAVSKLASGTASYVITSAGGAVWNTSLWDAGVFDGTPSWQPAQGGVPATATPLMNSGAGSVGVSAKFMREDAVAPTDTSRAPLASPAFTGTPTEPTVAAGTVVTSQQAVNWETLQRELGNPSTARPAVRASRTTAQSVPAVTWTSISWTTKDYDNGSMFSTTVNPTRLTADAAGTFVLDGACSIGVSSGGTVRLCRILKNGTTVVENGTFIPPSASQNGFLSASAQDQATIGDYYEFQVYQDSGGALNAVADASGDRFSAAWVGATGAAWGNAAARASGTTATATATATAIQLTTEVYDTDALHDTVTNPSRITVAVPGWYAAFGQCDWGSSGTGIRQLNVWVNGAQALLGDHSSVASSGFRQQAVSGLLKLNAGDYVQLIGTQTSGGVLNVAGDLQLVRVGYQTSSGAQIAPTKTITAAYTATANDYTIRADATSAAFSVQLPDATQNTGRVYNVKRINSGANNVTVTFFGTQTSDGSTTKVLSTQYQGLGFQSNGTTWDILP